MIYSKRPEWVTRVGLELTCMTQKHAQRRKACSLGFNSYGTWQTLSLMREELGEYMGGLLMVDCDDIIEWSTPILESYKEVERAYKCFTKAREQAGCVVMDRFYATGGGHIHFDGDSRRHIERMVKQFYARPWLNWFFNDINDNVNANHWSKCREEPTGKSMIRTKEVGLRVRVAYNWKHAEMRVFRAPLSYTEQLTHLYFLQAFVKWCETPRPAPKAHFGKDLLWYVAQFQELIEQLGLDFRDYRRFVPNLEDRLHYGSEWLR